MEMSGGEGVCLMLNPPRVCVLIFARDKLLWVVWPILVIRVGSLQLVFSSFRAQNRDACHKINDKTVMTTQKNTTPQLLVQVLVTLNNINIQYLTAIDFAWFEARPKRRGPPHDLLSLYLNECRHHLFGINSTPTSTIIVHKVLSTNSLLTSAGSILIFLTHELFISVVTFHFHFIGHCSQILSRHRKVYVWSIFFVFGRLITTIPFFLILELWIHTFIRII